MASEQYQSRRISHGEHGTASRNLQVDPPSVVNKKRPYSPVGAKFLGSQNSKTLSAFERPTKMTEFVCIFISHGLMTRLQSVQNASARVTERRQRKSFLWPLQHDHANRRRTLQCTLKHRRTGQFLPRDALVYSAVMLQ